MKIAIVLTMAVLAGTAAQADESTVTVCTEGLAGYGAAAPALPIADAMFASAGIKIDWRETLKGCPTQGILITLEHHTRQEFHPGALAYALPYEGAHIRVFYDRIAAHDGNLMPHLLAHVLVHEITHILQGVERHSAQGVMKAQWNQQDFNLMRGRSLEFTSFDIDLIHDGIAKREQALVAAK
jgi:hypothetical protein